MYGARTVHFKRVLGSTRGGSKAFLMPDSGNPFKPIERIPAVVEANLPNDSELVRALQLLGY
jgi:hypothetical protein